MKKLLLLFLAVAGMVTTASAVKLNLHLQSNSFFVPNDNARIMAHIYGGETEADVEMTKEYKYGNIWYSCELNGNTKVIIVRQNPDYGSSTSIDWDNGAYSGSIVWTRSDEVSGLSTTNDIYGELWYSSKLGIYIDNIQPAWSGLIMRDSKVGWSVNAANMETTDYKTFSKTYTKAEIESVSTAGTKFYFHFKHVNNVYYDESGTYRDGQWKEIHVSSDTEMPIGTSTDVTTQNNENSGNSWYITVPSYDYDHMVFTAAYVNEGGSYKWVISADAYIKKNISSEGYATFGSAANVDFSGVSGLTAQKGKVGSDGKITFSTATTLAAGEGALLSGAAGDYYIPVAVSASADQNNDFVAITTKQQINETMNSKNAYILAKVNGVLGFYKPAEGSGSWCAAGTAYLATNISAGARGFFPLWDDATAIEAAQQEQVINGEAYNLAGQRVAQPTKGLYIVNGKKVILK